MDLYSNISYRISKLVTTHYSTSFSLGIIAFSSRYKNAIYSIYGFVRIADEIVDTFHDQDKQKLFEEFRCDTYRSLDRGLSTNPVLHAFQKTVNRYNIDREYIEAFLHSMELDISNKHYHRSLYNKYVYGSAEVVGLMCLRVFCEGNDPLHQELIPPARALGSAFQKVNFLRDIKSDMDERGRIYLPGIAEKSAMTDQEKTNLESEIEEEFRHAILGIKKLPVGVKHGVYSAYLYYYILFKKITEKSISELMEKRVRISNITKFTLLIKSFITVKFLR
jgi:15-cis-phytoene synthase